MLVATWDLSNGHDIDQINWGADGWEVVDSEQFAGPVKLTILLPEDRRMEGRFAIVRALRQGEQVRHVSLKKFPSSAEKAYSSAKGILEGFHATEEDYKRLNRLYSAGPVAGPGEQLVLNLLESSDPPILGVDIDWVWGSSPDRNWVVTVAFSWRDGAALA